MIACMADGTKLPPYIVFKRKTLPKGVTFPSGAIVRTQAKDWMDDNLMRDWIDTVWGNRDGDPRRHDFHPTATRRRHQPSHEIHAKGKVGGVDAKREQDLHKVWTPTCPGLGHRH